MWSRLSHSKLRVPIVGLVLVVILAAAAIVLPPRKGRMYREISHIAFSPDGRSLALSDVSALYTSNPRKRYFTDVSRSIAVFDAMALTKLSTVAYEFRQGTQGPLDTSGWTFACAPDCGRLY